MKAIRILIITIALILAGITVQAEQGRGSGPMAGHYYEEETGLDNPRGEAKREEVRKKIEAVRMWRLTEELKLDEKTSTRLASFLSSIEEKRRALMKANRTVIREIRDSLNTPKPDERILKAGLDKIEKNQQDLIELKEKELAGIKEMLSVEHQARYLVFQQEFRREMRRMIAGAQGGDGPARRPQRGPERQPAR